MIAYVALEESRCTPAESDYPWQRTEVCETDDVHGHVAGRPPA